MVILRVQNLRYCLGHGALLKRSYIVALIKCRHIKVLALCAPKAQNVDGLAVLSRYHKVIRHGVYRMVACVLYVVVITVPPFVYLAVKINVNRSRRALLKPHAAAGQPKIGHFGLPAVY